MKIAEISIENYKGFSGLHTFSFTGNLIFLVGENNTGKSTLMEAVHFLISGLDGRNLNDIRNKNVADNSNMSVICPGGPTSGVIVTKLLKIF